MTVIDSFLSFASRLGKNERESVEEALADLMASYDPKYDFSPAELAEIERRVAEPHRTYASDEDIRRIFGHTFDD